MVLLREATSSAKGVLGLYESLGSVRACVGKLGDKELTRRSMTPVALKLGSVSENQW
jgi:hypothetical protein